MPPTHEPTHTHSHIITHTHLHAHTNIQTCTHIHIHVHTFTPFTCIHTFIHTYSHAFTHLGTHTDSHIHTCTRNTHTRARARLGPLTSSKLFVSVSAGITFSRCLGRLLGNFSSILVDADSGVSWCPVRGNRRLMNRVQAGAAMGACKVGSRERRHREPSASTQHQVMCSVS